jgi:DNA-binding transcriptional MerR regulator
MASPGYRIRKAAELSGLNPGLIRQWERRYHLLLPTRNAAGYRGYSDLDVALLRRLRELTDDGIPIGDAVKQLPQLRKALKPKPAAPAAAPGLGASVSQWVKRAMNATERGDSWQLEAVFDEALAVLPALTVFEALWVPLLEEAGTRWHQGLWDEAQEHLLSNAIRARLLSALHGAPRLARAQVICACLPDEEHELGLLGAALRLRQAGFTVTYLGARTPLAALARMAKRIKPQWVALSSTGDIGAKALGKFLAQTVKAMPKGARVCLGGNGAKVHRTVCNTQRVWCVTRPDDWHELLTVSA